MPELKKRLHAVRPLLSKTWVQWTLAAVFFLLISVLYMGQAITNCSATTTALNSDSTGGFAWMQWASGNSMSWGHTNVSNFPAGEDLNKPQFIASAVIIFLYRLLSVISSPICGLNLIVLLGYVSTGLVMFGLVRWLLRRFDIALFAGYAAAFVPYHQINSHSHVVYMFGSTFIATVWAYLWFSSKPSYRRALLMSLVAAIGFYVDGYFVLITALLIAPLFLSSFVLDFLKLVFSQKNKNLLSDSLFRFKRLLLSSLILAVLLVPILYVQHTKGTEIRQTFVSARGSIKIETVEYGARPIEFVTPSFDNRLLPRNYQNWRLSPQQQHNSNPSENTLYVGITILMLALISLLLLSHSQVKKIRLRGLSYRYLVFIIIFPLGVLLLFSMPSKFSLLGHPAYMPTRLLIKLVPDWRVMARLFLAIDPLIVILASLGLYGITINWPLRRRVLASLLLTVLLFAEYLPASFNSTGNLYTNSPKIYRQLAADPSIKTVAEYPITDFRYSPTIFTYQQLYKKLILNANDAGIARGPFDTSISGLNDPQTLGALRALNIDLITSYNANPHNPNLVERYPVSNNNRGGIPPIYSFKIVASVPSSDSVLMAVKGYDYFSIDDKQVSHRVLLDKGTMVVRPFRSTGISNNYNVSFKASTVCTPGVKAALVVSQAGKNLWSGVVSKSPVTVNFNADNTAIGLTTSCPVDITHMNSKGL